MTMTETIISGLAWRDPLPVRLERAPKREKDRSVSRDVFAVLIGSAHRRRS